MTKPIDARTPTETQRGAMRLDPGGDELLAGGELGCRDGERLRSGDGRAEGEGTHSHGREENAGAPGRGLSTKRAKFQMRAVRY